MKNKTYNVSTLILLLFTLLLASCSEDKSENTVNSNTNTGTNSTIQRAAGESDIAAKITVTNSTSLISESFFNMGVSRILVKNNSDEVTYNFVASKTFVLDDTHVHFSTKEFLLKDNFVSEINNPEYAVTLYNNQIYLRTPEKEDLLSKFENIERNENVHILLLFLNEITMSTNKLEFDTHMTNFSSKGGCSFSNTIYVYGIGLTSSAAASNLIHSVDGSSINSFSCRKLNATPELTNWGGFYTSTNTYCCRPGSGGSW